MELFLRFNEQNRDVVMDIAKLQPIFLASPIGHLINVRNLSEKTFTLGRREENNPLEQLPLYYDASLNQVVENKAVSPEGYDGKFLSANMALAMATNHKDYPGSYRGLNKFACFNGLDHGLRDNLAETLVKNDGTSPYEEEKIIANLFCHLYGYEFMMQSLLESKPERIIEKLQATNNEVIPLLINNRNHFNGPKSYLGEIEMELINLFMLKENVTPTEYENFRTELHGYFPNDKKHESANGVYEYFDTQLKNKLNNGKQL